MACSVHFVRRQLWAMSTESQSSHPNRRRTNCAERASKKIRPSKRLELHILLIVWVEMLKTSPSPLEGSSGEVCFRIAPLTQGIDNVIGFYLLGAQTDPLPGGLTIGAKLIGDSLLCCLASPPCAYSVSWCVIPGGRSQHHRNLEGVLEGARMDMLLARYSSEGNIVTRFLSSSRKPSWNKFSLSEGFRALPPFLLFSALCIS